MDSDEGLFLFFLLLQSRLFNVPRRTQTHLSIDIHGCRVMGRIVAVANQKGGVGKTTTSVNISASIALEGRSVLLIDMDPQGNATSGLGIDPRSVRISTYNILINKYNIGSVRMNTSVPGLSLLPSNADLAGAEIELVNIEGRESCLRGAIERVVEKYDIVLIDCPPALGILTVNALSAIPWPVRWPNKSDHTSLTRFIRQSSLGMCHWLRRRVMAVREYSITWHQPVLRPTWP
jgi:hypothetical protein